MLNSGVAIVSALILTTILSFNLLATRTILRDALSERGQKMAQLAMVWLLPMLGALIVLAVHRAPEKPLGRYPAAHEDDPESPQATSKLVAVALDD